MKVYNLLNIVSIVVTFYATVVPVNSCHIRKYKTHIGHLPGNPYYTDDGRGLLGASQYPLSLDRPNGKSILTGEPVRNDFSKGIYNAAESSDCGRKRPEIIEIPNEGLGSQQVTGYHLNNQPLLSSDITQEPHYKEFGGFGLGGFDYNANSIPTDLNPNEKSTPQLEIRSIDNLNSFVGDRPLYSNGDSVLHSDLYSNENNIHNLILERPHFKNERQLLLKNHQFDGNSDVSRVQFPSKNSEGLGSQQVTGYQLKNQPLLSSDITHEPHYKEFGGFSLGGFDYNANSIPIDLNPSEKSTPQLEIRSIDNLNSFVGDRPLYSNGDSVVHSDLYSNENNIHNFILERPNLKNERQLLLKNHQFDGNSDVSRVQFPSKNSLYSYDKNINRGYFPAKSPKFNERYHINEGHFPVETPYFYEKHYINGENFPAQQSNFGGGNYMNIGQPVLKHHVNSKENSLHGRYFYSQEPKFDEDVYIKKENYYPNEEYMLVKRPRFDDEPYINTDDSNRPVPSNDYECNDDSHQDSIGVQDIYEKHGFGPADIYGGPPINTENSYKGLNIDRERDIESKIGISGETGIIKEANINENIGVHEKDDADKEAGFSEWKATVVESDINVEPNISYDLDIDRGLVSAPESIFDGKDTQKEITIDRVADSSNMQIDAGEGSYHDAKIGVRVDIGRENNDETVLVRDQVDVSNNVGILEGVHFSEEGGIDSQKGESDINGNIVINEAAGSFSTKDLNGGVDIDEGVSINNLQIDRNTHSNGKTDTTLLIHLLQKSGEGDVVTCQN